MIDRVREIGWNLDGSRHEQRGGDGSEGSSPESRQWQMKDDVRKKNTKLEEGEILHKLVR
jgi:hypothetical protein